MCSKVSLRFVSFCLDLELFAKIKSPGSAHSEKPGLSNKIKNPEHPFVESVSRKGVKNFNIKY